MNVRNLALWAVILLLLIALFNFMQGPAQQASSQEITFSQLIRQAEAGEIESVQITGERIEGVTSDGQSFVTYAPPNADGFADRLYDQGVEITARPSDGESNMLMNIFISWFPMLLLIAVWIFFMRQMQSGGKGAMGFGKSKARLLTEAQGRRTFADVAGVDEAKEELLVGPPGTGKTLLARAVAGEANVPFFTISGSDFVEMFVGVGASRVRDMFEQAKKNAPCIIFIDEIDAVGRSRGAGLGGGNDEREQTLNQLLVEMDGFEANEGIILIAATNRPDVLDPALLRPGRFDRQVVVPNPDITGRERILKVHMKDVPTAPDVDPKVVARGTPGFSGADLANLVNEAALLAARRSKRLVTMLEFEDAKDKVMMGPERRSMVMSDKEKELTAYHEAGHAIVALNVPSTDPVHKATIIPRGRALGMVMQLPEADKLSMSREEMTSRLAILMGGRVAEEIKFGKERVTSGAASDIQMATKLARAMVTEYGLSDEMGPIAYGEDQGEVFLGQQIANNRSISPETAMRIETEIKNLVTQGYETARTVLTEKEKDWVQLSEALLEYETLTGDEIKRLLEDGEPPHRDPDEPPEVEGGGTGALPVTDDDEVGHHVPGMGDDPEPQGA